MTDKTEIAAKIVIVSLAIISYITCIISVIYVCRNDYNRCICKREEKDQEKEMLEIKEDIEIPPEKQEKE